MTGNDSFQPLKMLFSEDSHQTVEKWMLWGEKWVWQNIIKVETLINNVFGGSDGEESGCISGDLGLIPGLGRSPGEGIGYPLQYFGLENSMECVVHGGDKESDMSERLSLSCMAGVVLEVVKLKFCQPRWWSSMRQGSSIWGDWMWNIVKAKMPWVKVQAEKDADLHETSSTQIFKDK